MFSTSAPQSDIANPSGSIDDSDDDGDGCDDDGDIPVTIILTQVNIDNALKSSFEAELRRAENDEDDCEGAELTPPTSPSHPLAPLPSSFIP